MEKQDNELCEKKAVAEAEGVPEVTTAYPHNPPIVNQQLPPYAGPNINVNPYQYPNPNWNIAPQPIPNCPPGLEYLTLVSQLLIHQTVELLEVFTGFETGNKYIIKNSLGQRVFFAKEESDCCARNCCGSCRSFDMRIVDNTGREVIHLERPLACQSCWFPCCLQKMEVFSPPGILVGTIEQRWSLFYPTFSLKNVTGETMLRIKGPCCCKSNCCCADIEFDVISANGNVKVGRISKQWSGLAKEAFTDADNFGISFPADLDVRMKAVVLGACFLIDMMYFESNDKNNRLQYISQDGVPAVQQQYKCCCCCPAMTCGTYTLGSGSNGCCCCCN